jgi:alginate O-acetyltransferase complex protein AlgI
LSFVDAAFLFGFLPIVVLLHRLALRQSQDLANIVLVGATAVFCLPFGWPYVALVGLSAALNVFIATRLASDRAAFFLRGKVLLSVGVALNFSLLIVVKYLPATPMMAAVPGLVTSLMALVPASISFWTFQRTMLLVDAYQGEENVREAVSERRGLVQLMAFSLFFPNLITGPITYFSEVAPQLKNRVVVFFNADLAVGLTLLTFGLAKKVLIADPLAAYVVEPVFAASAAGQHLLAIEVAAGILGFYVQIYFDFAGYSEIALGLARLFGITLPINFDSPLRASSVTDFWRRWHISLTRVINRGLYIPLALLGTRRAAALRLKGWKSEMLSFWLPVLANFVVIALWHGAKLTYILFGVYHALWVMLDAQVRKTKTWKTFRKTSSDHLRRRLGQLLTFFGLAVSFSIFHVNSLSELCSLFGNFGNSWLGFFFDPQSRILGNREPLLYLGVAYFVVLFLPNTFEVMSKYCPAIFVYKNTSTTPKWFRFSWGPSLLWAVVVSAIACLVFIRLNQPAPFIYGGF